MISSKSMLCYVTHVDMWHDLSCFRKRSLEKGSILFEFLISITQAYPPIGLTVSCRTLNGQVRSLSSGRASNSVFAPQEGGGEGVNHVDMSCQNRGFLTV